MNKMNKKGISDVIATVLIILIAVAAVVIVWVGVLSMIDGRIGEGDVCLDAVGQVLIDADREYTCFNDDNVSLKIYRKAKVFELSDVQILISTDGNIESFSVVDDAVGFESLPGINEARVFVLDVSGASVDEIRIAPIVIVDGVRKTCDVSSSVKIQECVYG